MKCNTDPMCVGNNCRLNPLPYLPSVGMGRHQTHRTRYPALASRYEPLPHKQVCAPLTTDQSQPGPGMYSSRLQTMEIERCHTLGTDSGVNINQRPIAADLESSLPQDGRSAIIEGNSIPVTSAQTTRPLPLVLDLDTVRGVRAALGALQNVEHFLDHLTKHFMPESPCMSGQWRCVFDRIEGKLCEQKRRMKRTMYVV